MAKSARAWNLLKSFELGIVVGGLAGLLVIGVTYTQFVGELEPQESLLYGGAAAAVLTLIFTYVFDQVSKSVGEFRAAAKRPKGGSTQGGR